MGVTAEPTAAGGSLSGVKLARLPAEDLDEESSAWVRRLGAGGGERQAAERELYARLVRIALTEVGRRSAGTPVTGPELDDVAPQSTRCSPSWPSSVTSAPTAGSSRGRSGSSPSRVSSKLGRHYWRNPPVALDAAQWERLPDRLGIDPEQHAASAGILAEVRRVVEDELTAHQRRVFVAVVVDGIPLHRARPRPPARRPGPLTGRNHPNRSQPADACMAASTPPGR
jgi:RNA polymerase sigma-70 factor, ECF subfamily